MVNFRFPKLADFKNPKKRLKYVLFGGALTSALLFFIAIGLPATSNPKFCGLLCHSQKRNYYTWERSSHSNITCTACHVEQGLIPFFYEKAVEGPIGLYAEITGKFEKPINIKSHLGFEKMSSNICERCHDLKKRNVTPSLLFKSQMVGKGSQKYHAKHLKKGMNCTLCHNRITHKDVNDPQIIKLSGYEGSKKKHKDGMSMTEGCFRCHSPFKKERDGELIEKYKARKAPKECSACHEKAIMPLGHGKDWISKHPQTATKIGFKYCLKCHDKNKRFASVDGLRSRCRDCHHRLIADKKLRLNKCSKCHEEMAFKRERLVSIGQEAIRKQKNSLKAQYYRRMVYHKVHFAKNYNCQKCHKSDLESLKKPTLELCKNKGCHPVGQQKPPSGSKLCKLCHYSPHSY